jgi:hypothetical protein
MRPHFQAAARLRTMRRDALVFTRIRRLRPKGRDWRGPQGMVSTHAETVRQAAPAAHPQCLSPNGVLWSNTLRTVGLLGQPLEAA